MQRLWSEVEMDQKPAVWPSKKGSVAPVSYCFAVIKPSSEMASKYQAAMETEPTSRKGGALSDQDLLAEVLNQGHVLLPHNLVMFPSWFNHKDWLHFQGAKMLESVGAASVEDLNVALPIFVDRFGAVHFSRVFSMTTVLESEGAFLRQLIAANKNPPHSPLIHVGHDNLSTKEWAENFLLPLWKILHQRFHAQKKSTEDAIVTALAGERVPGGLAKALLSLRSVNERVDQVAVAGQVVQPAASSTPTKSYSSGAWSSRHSSSW
jgi:hypothetical protein